MERACAASTTFAGAADLIVAAQRRADGALGRPVGQRAGPEERGSDPLFRGCSRPSASRLCGGPWGSLPLCSGQEVARWRAVIGSRRRRAIDHDRDHDGGAQRSGLRTGCLGVRSAQGTMGAVQVEFDQDLVDLLEELHRPVKQAARELIVLELYRQGEASSGKAAELLGMERGEFIRYASARGIPYLQISGEELRREVEDSQAL